MVIQYILPDQDKLMDTLVHEFLKHLPFEFHDVVLHSIIPFTDQLNDGIFFFVICQQHLQV